MKNFEKYKTTLMDAFRDERLDGALRGLSHETDPDKVISWLGDEYKTVPAELLTDDEKDYIRKYFLDKFVEKRNIKIGISFRKSLVFLVNENAYFETDYVPDCNVGLVDDGFLLGKYYTLEELGL